MSPAFCIRYIGCLPILSCTEQASTSDSNDSITDSSNDNGILLSNDCVNSGSILSPGKAAALDALPDGMITPATITKAA